MVAAVARIRAVDRPEACAACYGGISQAPPAMTDEAGGRREHVGTGVGREQDVGHEKKERQRAQFVPREGIDCYHAGLYDRRFRAEHHHQADNADQPERGADAHPAENEDKQDGEADEAGGGRGEHHRLSRCNVAASAIRTQETKPAFAISRSTRQGTPSSSLRS